MILRIAFLQHFRTILTGLALAGWLAANAGGIDRALNQISTSTHSIQSRYTQ